MNDKILLIGSSGYLGRNLIKKINSKNKIICFDKKKIFLNKNDEKKVYEIYKANINNKTELKKAIAKSSTIFFRAGVLGGPESIEIIKSKYYIKENLEKLLNFLKLLKKKKIKKFIFDSSYQVFGNENAINNEIKPYNYYGLSKLICEKILINWCKENKVNLFIFRYPRVVCENSKNFISNMVLNALNNSELLLKNFSQKFTFVHLDDVLNSNILALKSKKKGINIINVSIKKEYNLIEIAELIRSKLKKKFLIKKILNKSKIFEPKSIKIEKIFFDRSLNSKIEFNLDKIVSKIIKKNNGFKKNNF